MCHCLYNSGDAVMVIYFETKKPRKIIKLDSTMPSEKMKYILRRAAKSAMRTDIPMSPLKEEIESIFNPNNIDDDCDTIASLLYPYKMKLDNLMSTGKYHEAFQCFYEILESLSYHFVKDEHYCYFDDMYSPDYTCAGILKSIISEIKSGKVPVEDVAFLDGSMTKIAKMAAYEDYGSPFCVSDWERYKG